MLRTDLRTPRGVPVWPMGLLLFGAIPVLFQIGFLAPSAALLLGILLLGFAWVWLSMSRPLLAFSIVLFVFVLAYSRLSIPIFVVEGHGNRGGLALGDLLWLGLIIALITRHFFPLRPMRYRLKFPGCIWVMSPFVTFAALLPIIGVIAGDWPLSYAIPGIRQIQWASLAIVTYSLCNKYGTKRVFSVVWNVMIFASVGHFIYALIQFGYSLDILGRGWVFWDNLFAASHENSWFFYPRLTGLQVNPNSYGLYSAFIFLLVSAMILARASDQRLGMWVVGFLSSLFGLAFSGSRSALLALMAASLVWFFLALTNHRLFARGLLFGGKITTIGILAFFAMWPLLPQVLQGRFERFLNVFSQGASADSNLFIRVEEWRRLLGIYLNDFPLGTWVPSSYATESAVDSFYMFTAVQGTPIFTVTWLLFLGGAIVLGWQLYRRSVQCATAPIATTCGLALAGWAGAFAGSGLTLSPMLQPSLIVPFWVLIGAGVAYNRGL